MTADLLRKAVALHQQGRLDQAAQLYRRIIEADPTQADALHLLGGIFAARGQLQQAETLIRAAISVNDKVALFHANYAGVLQQLGRFDDALTAADRAVALDAESAEGHHQRGLALHRRQDFEQAVVAYRRALHIRPRMIEAWNHLGNVYRQQGDTTKAENAFQEALKVNSRHPLTLQNLAGLFVSQSKADRVIDLLKADQQQHSPELENLLGQAHQLRGEHQAAKFAYQRALSQRPDQALWRLRAMTACPVIAADVAEITTWRSEFAQKIQQTDPLQLKTWIDQLPTSHAEPPFHLAYHGRDNLALKRAYAGLFRHEATAPEPKGERVRIAMLVTAGHERIFLNCCAGLIEAWDDRAAELTLIAPAASLKAMLAHLDREHLNVLALESPLSKAVQAIRDQAFHLIYFWEVGSDATNYFLPFFRLAPRQVTSWGQADTTGTHVIDTYLTSRLWDDDAEHYSENLVHLEHLPTLYRPPEVNVAKPDHFMFDLDPKSRNYLCIQNLFKIHPDCDQLWRRLLEKDPGARLILVEGKQNRWTQLLRRRLKRNLGSTYARVVFLGRLNYDTYLSLLKTADVLLDSLYFSGGNTSLEAMAAGVPVVTLPGRHIRGKFTYGCYRALEVMDAVADSPETYLERALSLAHNVGERQNLSAKIRANQYKLYTEMAAHAFQATLISLARGEQPTFLD